MLVVKKKDWETPFGDVILGKEYRGSLYVPTKEEVEYCEQEGFNHLIDGRFLWLLTDKHKKVRICLETIDSVTEAGSEDLVGIIHTSNGNFKINKIKKEQL